MKFLDVKKLTVFCLTLLFIIGVIGLVITMFNAIYELNMAIYNLDNIAEETSRSITSLTRAIYASKSSDNGYSGKYNNYNDYNDYDYDYDRKI